MSHRTDVVVVGAGPIGLFSVFEIGMLKMKCHVIDALDFIGGQCSALYPEKPIYDIPAYPRISAQDLINNLEKQIEPFAPEYHLGQQVIKFSKRQDGSFDHRGNDCESTAEILPSFRSEFDVSYA